MKKGLTIVNLAVTKSGKIRISKPCLECARMLGHYESLITKIIWTTETGHCEESVLWSVIDTGHSSTGTVHKLMNKIKKNP